MDWQGLERHRIELKRPLLIVKGGKGLLACGYLNVESFNRTGEAAAVVTGVNDFEDMLKAKVAAVSDAAAAAGIKPGMTGLEALERFR